MDALACSLCKDDATSTCARCEQPLCGMHKPWRAELTCVTCEADWDGGAWKRTAILFPLVLVGLLVGFVPVALFMALLDHSHSTVQPGLGGLVVMFGLPIATATWIVRRATKLTFRRRFLARKPARIPVARIYEHTPAQR